MKTDKKVFFVLGWTICWLGLIFSFFSCEDEIKLELNSPENQRIVVEGRITNELRNQQIRITRTLSYFQNELAPPLTGAEVYLIEEGTGQQYTLTLSDDSLGIYQTNPFAGHFGETYSLIINHDDQSYKASAYLDTIPVLDSLTFEYQFMNYYGFGFGIYLFKLSFYEPPPEGQYYRADIYINDTLYTDDIAEAAYLSDFQSSDMYWANIEIYSMPQERIKLDTNIIRIEMISLSEDEWDFLGEFFSETYGGGSIFSGPPANIRSNIRNTTGGLDGMGFFGASSKTAIESILIKEHNDSTNNPFMEVD